MNNFNFGQGYTEVEGQRILEVGDYECQIVDIQVGNYNNGNNFLKVIFSVEGNSDIQPNCTILNDRPRLGETKASGYPITEDDVRKWDKAMTKFFDCFAIKRGDFNFKNWQYKKGICHCDWQYDPKEADKKSKLYKQFTPKAPATTSKAIPTVSTPSVNANNANNVKSPADSIEDDPSQFNPFM